MSTTRRQTDNSFTIYNFNYIFTNDKYVFSGKSSFIIRIYCNFNKKQTLISCSDIITLPYMNSVCSLFALGGANIAKKNENAIFGNILRYNGTRDIMRSE